MPADDSLPNDAQEVYTTFSSFEQEERDYGSILLFAPGYDKPFAISRLSGYEVDVPDPEMLCGGDFYHVMVEEIKDRFIIHAISGSDNSQLLSAYDYSTANRNTQIVPCICLIIAGSAMAALSVFMILVGRHPERYPIWFRRIIYHDRVWSSQT